MSQSDVYFDMIEKDLDPEAVTQALLEVIAQWLHEQDLYQNEVQKKMMASHVKAMVERAKTRESLPDVDRSLFDEISAESLELATRAVNTLNDLPIEEAYLLSVHFEVARAND